MTANRKTAAAVGLLFIVATVASSLGFAILQPIQGNPQDIAAASASESRLILGVLLLLVDCAAVVAIACMLFPVFKKHSEVLAIGYVGSRIIESAILIVGSISLLSLLSVSREYVQAANPDAPGYEALGMTLLAVADWSILLGVMIVFSFTALILNYLLYQSRLVPRFISIWGLMGGALSLADGVLGMFGLSTSSTIYVCLALPIAVNEMVLAAWLIAKGFNARGQVETA